MEDPVAISEKIPDDFGAHNGTPISNKSTLLSEVDACIGTNKPPSVEYIFVAPFSRWSFKMLPWLSFAGNYYGQ